MLLIHHDLMLEPTAYAPVECELHDRENIGECLPVLSPTPGTLRHLRDYLANRVTNHPSLSRESAHVALEAQGLGSPKWFNSFKEK